MTVNGREYPMWSQFVEQRAKWIGGLLVDTGDSADRAAGNPPMSTRITDIQLLPNGVDSAFFQVVGEDFTCGFSVDYGGVTGRKPEGTDIGFQGYGGHIWGITRRVEATR